MPNLRPGEFRHALALRCRVHESSAPVLGAFGVAAGVYYRALHLLLRVALCTLTLADRDIVVELAVR